MKLYIFKHKCYNKHMIQKNPHRGGGCDIKQNYNN